MARKGSFVGFSYGTDLQHLIHSSTFGIVRTSDGDRFNDTLLPSFKDTIQDVNGRDGSYYFGSKFTQKTINLSIAFDALTEQQLRDFRAMLGDKNLHVLVLDEMPYKYYWVRPSGNPQLKYIAFNAEDVDIEYHTKDDLYSPSMRMSNGRLYKGEGSLSFVTFEAFAHSRYKYKDLYTVQNMPEWGNFATFREDDLINNTNEWINTINLRYSNYTETIGSVTYQIDTLNASTGKIMIYNPGDVATDFQLYIIDPDYNIPAITVAYNNHTLQIESFLESQDECGYMIDSKLHLIRGVKKVDNQYVLTDHIYNQHITSGDFFKLDNLLESKYMQITGLATGEHPGDAFIHYDYLFY